MARVKKVSISADRRRNVLKSEGELRLNGAAPTFGKQEKVPKRRTEIAGNRRESAATARS
jgi:hypothetical protein